MQIRILHIVSFMQRGGLETMIMNCYRNIDREQIQFDFIVHRSFRSDYDDEIETLGGKIYRLPRLNPFSLKYKTALVQFFRNHPEYRVVHCHLDCMSALPLAAAKQCGVPVRIAHAHSNNQIRNWKYPLKKIYMRKIPAVATHFFACSEEAGRWMFPGQNVSFIKNGIDTSSFSYNEMVRNEVRRELGLEKCLTIAHVGRFMPEKNHMFLLDIFADVHRQRPDAKLLLVGNGPLMEKIQDKVNALELRESVFFLGVRDDVHRLWQAVDVFVLPSLYEGLSLTAVEAQTAGVQCLLSDTVSAKCKMTSNVVFASLSESSACWADLVLRANLSSRTSQHRAIQDAGFDAIATAKSLEAFYLSVW